MAQGVLHLPVTAMPAHVRANSVEVSLLRVEAVVFVTKYLAHLLKQSLGLGKIGDWVHKTKPCIKIQFSAEKTSCQAFQPVSRSLSATPLSILFRRINWFPRISDELHHVRLLP